MDGDEFGLIVLKEKLQELGYTEIDARFYSFSQAILKEVTTDYEVWSLANELHTRREVEIWVENRGNDSMVPHNIQQGEEAEDIEGQKEYDSAYEEFSEYEYDINYSSEVRDDYEFDQYVDPTVEYGGFEDTFCEDIVANSWDKCSDYPNLSDNASIQKSDSDGDSSEDQWPIFNSTIDMADPLFTMGMTFASKQEFKEAVENYAFKNGKDLKFVKNDKERFIVECRHDHCPWRISLRKVQNSLSWRILGIVDKHDGCSWIYHNTMVNSSKVAKRWTKQIKNHNDWKMEEFRQMVCTEELFHVNERQTYRAIAKARKKIQGDEEDNFNKLWSYVAEINRTNPRSTCVVKLSDLTDISGKKRFLRFYMCWEACRMGFQYCRPIVGVDGCHLKTLTKGQMLVAVGIDANDSIFPLAYAIVEGETKDSWSWFLQLLKRDLVIAEHSEHEFTFISDKQKGLIPAFQSVLPGVEHRFCVRHLHDNFKVAGFQGKAIKDALWACARATTVNSFTAALGHLKGLDVNAFQWLSDKHPREWSRSHFSCIPHCDMLVNNICECFNAVILEARKQPIISCLEIMRKIVMTKLYDCMEKGNKWSSSIYPRILEKLEAIQKQAGGYLGIQCGHYEFEIRGMYEDQQQVNLEKKTCSCRMWDLTGIPCKHAVCAIWLKNGKGPVTEYVHQCYSRETYLQIYGASIHPMAGPEEWPTSNRDPPLPPLYTTRAGMPKKLRKKSTGELTKDGQHVARTHIKLHCSKCRKPGHNSRTCPDNPKSKEKQMKPRKRVGTPVSVQLRINRAKPNPIGEPEPQLQDTIAEVESQTFQSTIGEVDSQSFWML